MFDGLKGEKPKADAPAKEPEKKKKKAPELAVFKPRKQFMWGPKCIEPVNRDDNTDNLIRLTPARVITEIKLGVGNRNGGKVKRPVSPILNHCDLVSGSKQVTETLEDFHASMDK